jgi:hypothetical protein
MLDHINEDKQDNRLCNLRPANGSLNMHNRSRFRKKSDLPMGVTYEKTDSRGSFHKNPYRARIRAYGAMKPLGRYATAEEAAAAYREAKEVILEFEALKSEAGFYG